MKTAQYKVVVSDKGFTDFEEKVSKMLNEGWKPVGGIAFNHSYPHQAMAKIVDAEQKQEAIAKPENKALTANQAMKRIDDLT